MFHTTKMSVYKENIILNVQTKYTHKKNYRTKGKNKSHIENLIISDSKDRRKKPHEN